MKKIIYFDKSKIFSGAEQSLLQILKHLDRTKYIPYLCFDYPKEHQQFFTNSECESFYLSDSLKWWMGSERWKHPIRGTDFIKRLINGIALANLSKELHADIVHVNLLWPNSFCELYFLHRTGVQVVGHVRSFLPSFKIPRNVLRMLQAIICVSDVVQNEVLTWYEHPKVFRLYNPIDATQYQPKCTKFEARKELNIDPDAKVLSSVGLLEPQKGHDTAIKVFASLQKQFSRSVLMIAGGGCQNELNRLKELARDLKVDNSVVFTVSQHTDIATVYCASDIVLSLTTCGEAFGRVPLEAAAAGRFVITTNKGAAPEFIHHRANGILVNTDNCQEIVGWCEQYINNPNQFTSMIETAQRDVSDRFSPIRYTAELESIYQSILDRPTSAY